MTKVDSFEAAKARERKGLGDMYCIINLQQNSIFYLYLNSIVDFYLYVIIYLFKYDIINF